MKHSQDENETFFQRLELALSERDEKLTPVGARAGISKGYCSKIRNGYLPSKKVSLKLASELSVNHDWLRFGKGEMEYGPAISRISEFLSSDPKASILNAPNPLPQENSERRFTDLPLLGVAAAGSPGGFLDHVPDEYIPVPGHWSATEHYLVRVAGKSMEPDFPDKSLAIVRALRDGEYAMKNNIVIAVDPFGATIKKLIYEKAGEPNKDGSPRRSRPHLASINPEYPEHVPYSTDTPIRGIVVASLASEEINS